jgi:Ca2+/Na+ antiporter
MDRVILVGNLDVAELVFYAFVLFFICLVFYLRREDRREGYPLEDEITGRVDSAYGLLTASTYKEFRLPFDLYAHRQPARRWHRPGGLCQARALAGPRHGRSVADRADERG